LLLAMAPPKPTSPRSDSDIESGQGLPCPPAPSPAPLQALRRGAQEGGPRVAPAAFPCAPAGSAARARLPRASRARAGASTHANDRAGRRGVTRRYADRSQITNTVYRDERICTSDLMWNTDTVLHFRFHVFICL
jgi:hypothetical protein